MKNTNYNGWYNYETWLFNLHHDGMWYDTARELVKENQTDHNDQRDSVVDQLADIIRNDEIIYQDTTLPPFIHDIMDAFLAEVNFEEIAAHYINEITPDDL